LAFPVTLASHRYDISDISRMTGDRARPKNLEKNLLHRLGVCSEQMEIKPFCQHQKLLFTHLVFSNSSSFSWMRRSISWRTWDSSSWLRNTLFSSCSRAASASSRAACSSSFSTSRRFLAFSISWMLRPPSPIWSRRSLTSSESQSAFSTALTVQLQRSGQGQTLEFLFLIVRLQFLSLVSLKIRVFWDFTQC